MSAEPFRYERSIPAPRARLYSVWTEPAHIAASSAPPGGTFESPTFELRVGGRHHYNARGADGNTTWGLREFTAIEPGKRLQWRQSFSDASGQRVRPAMAPAFPLVLLSTIEFDDVPDAPGSTRITLTWEPVDASDEERAFFAAARDGMRGGWDAMFAQIERYVATLA